MNGAWTSWVANVSTAVTTIVLLVGLGKRYIVRPFQKYVSEQVVKSIDNLRKEVGKVQTEIATHNARIEELQESNQEIQRALTQTLGK